MACLKCGRETENKEVFCAECLQVMENSTPIKPGTPVAIPQRPKTERRVPAPKQTKPEEIIGKLNKTIKRLWVAVSLLAVLFTASAGALGYLLYLNYNEPELGSNYNTISTDTGGNR